MIRNDDAKPEFMGGTISGIVDKIDYLIELGVECVLLSPFYQTNAYHGYHITDYKTIGEQFGTFGDLSSLIGKLHAQNIKLIIDYVPNHCSVHHPFFTDAQQNKNSQYSDWFIFTKWPNEYQSFLGFKEIPKLNLENQSAQEYLISTAEMWLALGIDGLRIDHAIGPSTKFWKQFKDTIKSSFPHSFIFGEIWTDGLKRKYHNLTDIPDKSAYNKNSVSQIKAQLAYSEYFDGTLDFLLQSKIQNFFSHNTDITEPFRRSIQRYLCKYSDNYRPIGFLDNHDMNRFSYSMKNDFSKLKKAYEFLFSLPIPLIIYYGTETGIIQQYDAKNKTPHADINARSNMNWENINTEYLIFFKHLISERKKNLHEK